MPPYNEPTRNCSSCGKFFPPSKSLKNHRGGRPNDGTRLSCNEAACDFQSCGPDAMAAHKGSVHNLPAKKNHHSKAGKKPNSKPKPQKKVELKAKTSPEDRFYLISCGRCFKEFPNPIEHSKHCQSGCTPYSVSAAQVEQSASNRVEFPEPDLESSPIHGQALACHTCWQIFESHRQLSRHRLPWEWPEELIFGCSEAGCLFVTCNAIEWESHHRSHNPPSSVETSPRILRPRSPSPDSYETIEQPHPNFDTYPDSNTSRNQSLPYFTPCSFCFIMVRTEFLEQHANEDCKAIRCPHCQEDFESENSLVKHQAAGSVIKKIEVVVIDSRFVCPCGETLTTKASAIEHIREDNGHPLHIGFCFLCEVSFPDVSDYVCHNERLHGYAYPENFPSQGLDQAASASRYTVAQHFEPRQLAESRSPVVFPYEMGPQTSQGNRNNAFLICAICRGFPERLTATECGDLCCYNCIVTYLQEHGQCPICRRAITVKGLREVFL